MVALVMMLGGSAYDDWFSCTSNQVTQVLLTLPYSCSQLGMLERDIVHSRFSLCDIFSSVSMMILAIL
ncbi:hypothetical protein ISN45_Aa07g035100 [Arabidopsis thaliana x Arabidopsis arenosa]|uniref:Uncharacterized protein n=1 Tax=Arabidopsis thaliana x Arabidopsis arenosa TaxID=1240361 RepID=A0A8T1YAL7_9BRAS|nr:hypothetical protein ISN45_Aa07g035100 [Arabidopsis thaliana x Arabidopsis arenosa]KAG7543611.1 hypothetical protein ISN45_Aa07g035100 [Arabidopsis thaliana x Arabidopsis arenosa]